MIYLWWTLTVLLMAAGLIGTVLPLVPGTTLIFAGAVLHRIGLGEERGAAIWTLVVLGVLMGLSYVVDFLSGAAGAKYFGASRWGALGGLIGAVVGIFFGLIGLIVGPLIGVLVFELAAGKEWLPAGKSAWGTVVGTVAGTAGKVAIGVLMIAVFIVALIF